MTCAYIIQSTGNVVLACLAAIGIAVAAECINGFAISYLELNGFIVTLATQLVFKGLALLICDGTPIYGTPGITFLAQSRVFGIIPPLIIFMLLSVVIVHFILNILLLGDTCMRLAETVSQHNHQELTLKKRYLLILF